MVLSSVDSCQARDYPNPLKVQAPELLLGTYNTHGQNSQDFLETLDRILIVSWIFL